MASYRASFTMRAKISLVVAAIAFPAAAVVADTTPEKHDADSASSSSSSSFWHAHAKPEPIVWGGWVENSPTPPPPSTKPTTARPTRSPPSRRPTQRPSTARPTAPCTSSFAVATYEQIDEDIYALKESIRDDADRTHFLGGIVRLAAHDFMDYDPRSNNAPMGPDGCFDEGHGRNSGLESIWCTNCPLTRLHRRSYGHISRADFWIAAANAVIRQQSVDNGLDLRHTFRWGRRDRDTCGGSGDRLPSSTGCEQSEEVFMRRMGLEWRDVVALMGAHTLGSGNRDFSGHHGTWVSEDNNGAQVFDKQYYVDMLEDAWRPRNQGNGNRGGVPQDWTTGRGDDRVMLNTDICLAFDIDGSIRRDTPCCTRIENGNPDGRNECTERDAARRRCPRFARSATRKAARDAVQEFSGGRNNDDDDDNASFYAAFAEAWQKATTVGQRNLSPLTKTCELE